MSELVYNLLLSCVPSANKLFHSYIRYSSRVYIFERNFFADRRTPNTKIGTQLAHFTRAMNGAQICQYISQSCSHSSSTKLFVNSKLRLVTWCPTVLLVSWDLNENIVIETQFYFPKINTGKKNFEDSLLLFWKCC